MNRKGVRKKWINGNCSDGKVKKTYGSDLFFDNIANKAPNLRGEDQKRA